MTFITAPGAGNYRWDYGDGSAQVDGGYVAYHLYENFTTAAEVHTVELTTTSFYGCQDTRTLDITVEPIPAPNFTRHTPGSDLSGCYGDLYQYHLGGPWTYRWDFGDGNTSTQENPVHTYADPGTYHVKFYVNNGDCIDSTGSTVVIHPRVPVAAFAEPPRWMYTLWRSSL